METTSSNTATISTAAVDAQPAIGVEPASLPLDRPVHAQSHSKRTIFRLIALLLIAGAGVYGYHLVFGKAKTLYTTAAVTRGDIENTVVAAGIIQPVNYVDVGAQTSGKLKSLKVKRGDHVLKDQLLAIIDPELADTALISAKAALDNMTAQRADKQAQLVLTKEQLARTKKLFKQGYISASDLDVARAAYAAATADAASLSAQMKEASEAIATAKANVGYTKITAPMAGEIVSISLLEGQTLNANQSAPTILRIGDISTVTVWAQVSEADIVHVKPAQDVYFTILGDTRRWNGKIRQILPTPELINNVVFYDVLFDIPNPQRELEIQMTAQVFIVLEQAKAVLLIPVAAIGNAGEGTKTKVKVLKADGSVEQRAIDIGIKSEISAEVSSGLQENEKVVLGVVSAKKKSLTSALSGQKGP